MDTQRILQLEQISKLLEPNPEQRQYWYDTMGNFAHSFVDHLTISKAYRPIRHVPGSFVMDDKATGIEELLEYLQDNMLSQGLNPASGGHLGYIPGGGLYAGALGDFFAAICNQYAGIYFGGPGAVKMENELIRWMCRLMDYPESSHGNLTSGGSIANLIAIVTARESRQLKSSEITSSCIYLTHQVHHCIHKAIRISGLSEAVIRIIDMDDNFCMNASMLEQTVLKDIQNGLKPFMIIASAGTTDTGAVDHIEAIADISDKYSIWFHIDAAYGGFFKMVDDPVALKFSAMGRSDSLAIDPHKGLFLSYGLGAVLIKDVKSMYAAHYYKAAYMQDSLHSQDELSPCDLSPELTKHFRGLRMWLALKIHGEQPFKDCLLEKILLCRYFYEKAQEMGFRMGPYPELSVCIYRYENTDADHQVFNQKIVEYVVSKGRIFVSSTLIDGLFWIRIAVLSFRTHLREIDMYIDDLKEALEIVKSLK